MESRPTCEPAMITFSAWLNRWWVILRREALIRASYRLTALTGIVSTVMGIIIYGLLGSTAIASTTSNTYGMSLGSYLISGVAFSPIVASGLGLFLTFLSPNSIEEVLVTRTGLREYLIAASSFTLMTTVASAVISFTMATLVFGIQYSYDIPLLAIIILLGTVTSIGLGYIGLAFNLVFKQTAVLSWLLYTFTGLVGNMLVPVQVLPAAVQALSFVTPQYYFFTGIRVALGSQVAPATDLVGIFTIYSLFLLGLGVLSLNRAMRSVRRTGTLRWV